MSKLGKKLIAIICAMLILTSFVVMVVTVLLVRSNTSRLMLDTCKGTLNQSMMEQSGRVMNAEINWDEAGILSRALETRDFAELESLWTAWQLNQNDFIALADDTGTVIWSKGNYGDESKRLKNALNGTVTNGIVNDTEMVLEYVAPVKAGDKIAGACAVGLDLSETKYLDRIKSGTTAEVTLFKGSTRHATTILKENGERATGTEMSDDVKSVVLEQNETFSGTTKILGVSHYALYGPLVDVDGNTVGSFFVGFPSTQFNTMFNSIVVVCVIIALVIAVIGAVVITVALEKMVLSPIRAANKIAKSMKVGALSSSATNYNFRNDEIGEFARTVEDSRHILNDYVNDISNVLKEMSKGDFRDTSLVEYIGDFVSIKESFEGIQNRLAEILRRMDESAESVRSGAGNIAEASQLLADGTEAQAAAITELSHAIDDISADVKASSENAANADSLSLECGKKIELQNSEMDNMINAMNEIEAKSNQIMNIIKTIEDIAFQTNILALNAAVEAARAGEAGKGFAVVADEVRNLASKSAEAAGSTNALIVSAIEAIHNGSKIAEGTAGTMKEVVDIFEQINALISEISAAAENQNEAIEKVTESISKIGETVQHNSATAEQTAASCEELSGQSDILQEQIMKLHV